MMQGAHFLSHNLWTLLLDWTICVLCYRALLYRPARHAAREERGRFHGEGLANEA
jgi:membrane-associated PAP2 superfamily phosphatase